MRAAYGGEEAWPLDEQLCNEMPLSGDLPASDDNDWLCAQPTCFRSFHIPCA